MAKFPALPLWIDALTADTHHLTHCEFGLYMRLLILMWQTPGCRLPNDVAWIAKRLHSKTDEFKSLLEEFCQTDGNWITQKRLNAEYGYVTKTQQKRSVSAKRRWNKEKDSYGVDKACVTDLCQAPTVSSKPLGKKQEDLYRAYAPIPTPILSSLSSSPDSLNLEADSEERSSGRDLDFDTFWVQYPHKVGKGAARKSFAAALKKVKMNDLMAALHRYAAKQDDRPWCNPATWLNQERWLDQPAPNNGSTNGRNGRHETVIDKGRRLYERAAAIEAAKSSGRTDVDDGSDFFGHADRGGLSDIRQGK